MVDFYHYTTIDVSGYQSGDLLFNRVYIQDSHNEITEIPSDGTEWRRIRKYGFEFN